MITINVNWLNLVQDVTISNAELIKSINHLTDDERKYIKYNIDVPEELDVLKLKLIEVLSQISKLDLDQSDILIFKSAISNFDRKITKKYKL